MDLLGDIEHGFSATINGVEHFGKSLESLVEHTASELESIGIAVWGDIRWLVEFLIKEGEDPVHVLSRIQSHISSIGGDVMGTLEQLANGVMNYGLTGFLRHELEGVLSPIKETLNKSTLQGQAIADVHTTTISTMQAKIDLLKTGSGTGTSWQGSSADEMSLSLGSISDKLNLLSDPISGDGAQATLNQICIAALDGILVVAIAMAIVDILLLIASAIVTMTGVGAIVAAGVDAGVLAAELEIILALIAADALAWILGTLGIYLYHAFSHPATSTTQANSTATTIPQDWANSPAIDKWRENLKNALKAKGLTDAQIIAALASAAAVVKAMECNGYTAKEIDAVMNSWADMYNPNTKQLRKSAVKGSFWFILALLVKKETGYDLIDKLTLPDPNKIPKSDLDGYRRVLRSVLATDGEDGNGRPVVPAIISGGPTNIAAYGSKVYSNASGNSYLSQVEYDELPPEQKAMWHLIDGDIDIVTQDGKHIEVGGTNKAASEKALEHFENVQIDRLLKMPGGRSTAYVFLERPGEGSSPVAVANFERAVSVARSRLDPSHVIIINSPSNTCVVPR